MEGVAKCILPSPPFPPGSRMMRRFSPLISVISFPLSASFIRVPAGTFKIRSFPFFPCILLPSPSSPSPAEYFILWRNASRLFKPSSTSTITSPPFPPSPPSGPPAGTYNSLRKETCPFPPFPLRTTIFAVSANIEAPKL